MFVGSVQYLLIEYGDLELHLHPRKARQFAAAIIQAADDFEAGLGDVR